jgi:hypothetical protein
MLRDKLRREGAKADPLSDLQNISEILMKKRCPGGCSAEY